MKKKSIMHVIMYYSKVINAHFFPNIDSINIYFKVVKIFFGKLLEKKLKNDVEYNFTEKFP